MHLVQHMPRYVRFSMIFTIQTIQVEGYSPVTTSLHTCDAQ